MERGAEALTIVARVVKTSGDQPPARQGAPRGATRAARAAAGRGRRARGAAGELRPLGAQRVDDPGTGSELRAFYWTRVTLADAFAPAHEVAQRRLVGPDAFLDALSWGRRDPIAARLLDRALAIERELRAPLAASAAARDARTGGDRGPGRRQPS